MPTEREVLDRMPDGVVIADAGGEIVYANHQAELMTGYRRRELLGRKVEVLVPAGLRSNHLMSRRRFSSHPEIRRMGAPTSDFKLRRKDGSVAEVDVALAPVDSHTVAVMRDVSERRMMEDALEHRALHDPLTDLANRSLFFDRLRQSIHSARREGSQLALVMLDLDDFKDVNDRYGHAVGDDVLKEMAARLRVGLRATDTAARIGGDEFAWILPRASSRDSVERTVLKHLAAVEQPIAVKGEKLQVGVTAGVAMYPEDGRDVDTLLRHADLAMYAAKRRGLAVVSHLLRKAQD